MKKHLEQIKYIDTLIDSKLSEIYKLEQIALSITTKIKPDKVQVSGIGDKVGNCAARIADLKKEIDQQINKLIDLRTEILNAMECLNNTEYALVYKRYFQYKSWSQIEEEMYYTRQWLSILHSRALKKLESVYINLHQFT